ncbi:uncharacterized protein L3040_006216 [Drepanopeziza brunnea f. sp. 'multigermtubi']|uniref:Cenp-O kinetochore centromere component n=1 Tax=Marssonina brunnea f. sp. multigermtubi (strain MB_m1) TaxID=1072389 RepID=K1WH57_MARBU|nr:cenp-O kinetochore centromere component [Drepanopeziza brunnea f. sp. 'multigermtubi' MB_m1]EKD16930.1 cenp-O kinetochore centromere component [Drepanopeziza brunnea f. sp. 'multigermtubi' MB_m1]KAJ5040563.1 hypothetical protein L3040_006216 [Drepanopeziza brunnea f. sp. 'multigermtubi']
MLLPTDAPIIEEDDTVGERLDNEISSLREQILALKAQRKLQASTILSSRHTRVTLTRLLASQKAPSSQSSIPADADPLLAASTAQLAHKQENLYRTCAGITTFRVQDPDPNSVDGGNVLGIRIDVSSTGRFIRPYYVMLNKPWKGSALLRVHRHTFPPAIPLAALAEKHLPHGKGSVAMSAPDGAGKKQDLRRFVRALRREVMGYHNRVAVIKSLRREFKLDEKVSKKGKGRERVISDISAADAEAKQVRIEWADGRIGRAVVDEKGEMRNCVVIGEDGRDRETERRISSGSMQGIGERLRESMY